MVSRALISISVCLASALPLAGATVQTEKINGLLNNSPFGQSRPGGAAAGTGSNDPLEFRAVLEDKGGTMFSIYDTAAKRSIWVQLKDSTNGFAVNDYDAVKESVTVDYHGRSMTLPIKRAPAVAASPAMPRPNLPGAFGPMATPGQPGQVGPTPVDQQRMQQIQEEIRRRRALREQPAGNTNPAAALTGPQMLPNSSPATAIGPQLTPSNSPGPQPVPSNSTGPQPTPAKP